MKKDLWEVAVYANSHANATSMWQTVVRTMIEEIENYLGFYAEL